MEGATTQAAERNPLCGDELTLWLRIEHDVLADVSFVGSGCAISQASASMMTTAIKGKTRAEAEVLFERFHELVTAGPVPRGDADAELGRSRCSPAWHASDARSLRLTGVGGVAQRVGQRHADVEWRFVTATSRWVGMSTLLFHDVAALSARGSRAARRGAPRWRAHLSCQEATWSPPSRQCPHQAMPLSSGEVHEDGTIDAPGTVRASIAARRGLPGTGHR